MENDRFQVLNPEPKYFDSMAELSLKVYPFSPPWSEKTLSSHQRIFKEGQFIILDRQSQKVVAMAFCLKLDWDDYEINATWKEFTDGGYFTNHDPKGRTLYGAEIMVDPDCRGMGLGKLLYKTRFDFAKKIGALRIRAGARLPGYATYQGELTPLKYVGQVVEKKIFDSTLSFQLRQGFKVLSVVKGYLALDPESLGNAALIEWLNPEIATPDHFRAQQERLNILKDVWKTL